MWRHLYFCRTWIVYYANVLGLSLHTSVFFFLKFHDKKPFTFTFYTFQVPNFKQFLWNIGTGNNEWELLQSQGRPGQCEELCLGRGYLSFRCRASVFWNNRRLLVLPRELFLDKVPTTTAHNRFILAGTGIWRWDSREWMGSGIPTHPCRKPIIAPFLHHHLRQRGAARFTAATQFVKVMMKAVTACAASLAQKSIPKLREEKVFS